MKVLLVNPNREQVPWPAIPVGLCTVASATARRGHDVSVLDLAFSKQPGKDTLVISFSPTNVPAQNLAIPA